MRPYANDCATGVFERESLTSAESLIRVLDFPLTIRAGVVYRCVSTFFLDREGVVEKGRLIKENRGIIFYRENRL